MRRRTLLVLAGSAVTAGCSSLGAESPQSRFAGEPCPELTGETTCYYTRTRSGRVVLEPATERVGSPSEPLRFTLHNPTAASVRVVLTFPAFARRFGGRWQRLPHRRQDDGGVAEVEPGGTREFALLNGEYRDIPGVDTVTTHRYGAGEFAYAVWLSDPGIAALARVTVGGEPLSLRPPRGVRTSSEGETLVVSHPVHDGDPRAVTLTFEEAPPAANSIRVAPEVVAGRWDLRSVALLEREGITAVRVRTVEDYFRRPVQWLEAAGVWEGSDRTYTFGDLTVTVDQRRDVADP